MGYVNAKEVLPDSLLSELQKHIQGKLIYIPKSADNRAQWGELNGTREMFEKRNQQIANLYQKGQSIEGLMERFHLSEESIRKIITST